MNTNSPTLLTWSEKDTECSALWRSEQNLPARVVLADDTLTADAAYRLACEGSGLLWRGDFQNARQLLQAMARRIDKPQKAKRKKSDAAAPAGGAAFHAHRQAQAQRTRVLSQVLIALDGDYSIGLRRAPDAKQACVQAFGPASGQASVISLRALQGVIGAFEWRKNGVELPALGEDLRIHPHYGVFSPVRGEYVSLVAKAPLPEALKTHAVAFDIGVGTGVLSAVLARRGAKTVVATDMAERALVCARDNLQRLGLQNQVQLLQADLFPPGQAALVVCNPPWLPARPTSVLEQAVYDEGSQMLKGFLAGLKAHLCEGGEGWLILSDLAEHLGLRTREALLGWITDAGLQVLGRMDVKPAHNKTRDESDPLHAARAAEVTSLWRLGAAG
ncbi:class I SAM-dependent methyltransferase [Limnohabitans lacus]|uniref:Class I SAM-dependent methyltransferase n=1 Tax=Limnohabitans lacus TaxID=3045173 RepID=A0ABT6XAA8_9BURK|nr:class I SAM-dependent methyltransferase [Limnohabitans sp. HM2-2]MDI9235075.1 class I SAM-dependent methyltransferase [Limnohabitans sp. HM2-2]